MTRRATKTAKPAGRKSNKLTLSKKTMKDLTPRSRGGTVVGGVNRTQTCTCI
jgi:hypothetical protein